MSAAATFTGGELIRAGIPARWVQWWRESGLVTPEPDRRRGWAHVWNRREARLVLFIAALRERGVALAWIRRNRDAVAQIGRDTVGGVVLIHCRQPQKGRAAVRVVGIQWYATAVEAVRAAVGAPDGCKLLAMADIDSIVNAGRERRSGPPANRRRWKY